MGKHIPLGLQNNGMAEVEQTPLTKKQLKYMRALTEDDYKDEDLKRNFKYIDGKDDSVEDATAEPTQTSGGQNWEDSTEYHWWQEQEDNMKDNMWIHPADPF